MGNLGDLTVKDLAGITSNAILELRSGWSRCKKAGTPDKGKRPPSGERL